ncbi:MAG: alpha/beta fold hydrolase, partial [Verrucomicrobiota bacterium]
VETDSDIWTVVCHGLEGSSQAPYMKGMAAALNAEGWNVALMNFRGCSGEHNRLLRAYHSGETRDLAEILEWLVAQRKPRIVGLVGFSLGGNVVMKYAAERGVEVPGLIKAVAGISVPCDLPGCSRKMGGPSNRLYMKRFMNCLRQKVRYKQMRFPDAEGVDFERALKAVDFAGFDDSFTAPVHGFASAEDYWERAACRPIAHQLSVPTLLLNAADDPFLTEASHLRDVATDHPHLHVELTDHGGHVGFVRLGRSAGGYYQEERVVRFFQGRGW